MILDAALMFDNDVAHLTTDAGTDYIDLGAVRDLGVGEPLYVVAIVTTAFTDSGSTSTQSLTIETDDNTSFSTPALARITLGTFAALAPVGTRLVKRLSPEDITQRYMRVYYTVANGDLTTGKFKVFLTKDIQAYTSYADGITIS
jgi:hypothetical protein